MVLPTQAFLEDIGLSEEVGSEEGQEVYVEDEAEVDSHRPSTPRCIMVSNQSHHQMMINYSLIFHSILCKHVMYSSSHLCVQ